MVSSLNGLDSDYIQQLMAQMMQNIGKADNAEATGLSGEELSSIDTGNGSESFINALITSFDKIDSDSNGQLTKEELLAVGPSEKPMGPPPGFSIEEMFSINDTDGKTGLSIDELSSIQFGNEELLSRLNVATSGNSDSLSGFGDNLGKMGDYFVKQLLNAYEKNESGFGSALKSTLTSGLQSGLQTALDLVV